MKNDVAFTLTIAVALLSAGITATSLIQWRENVALKDRVARLEKFADPIILLQQEYRKIREARRAARDVPVESVPSHFFEDGKE